MNEDDGYTFVATLFSSTDDPNIGLAHYYLKNPDSTLYHDIYIKENDPAPDSLLDGKIFVYYWRPLYGVSKGYRVLTMLYIADI